VRPLSADEAELWARVAATIRPLSREKIKQSPGVASEPTTRLSGSLVSRAKPTETRRAKPIPIGERTLDGSWDKRLGSGRIEPDRMLDLHGMSLDAAWAAIDRGLERAIVRGDRVLLMITGHHRPGEPPVQRGKIRAAVHDWLAASRHAPSIAAVRGAHRRHGGGGSLYIILKR
jgi:DNA-nicking Smr family endonuclease